ncbi:competence protein ComEC [Dyadobacter sp. BE34]|uniref:Competence protein ComEC n=1 Tax=Dyadobacter fermentans TaxID=94254 RepID=A0ABU1QXS0_9BACT|nr:MULTISPECIES: ComEC/Rec2 family competence protein [Dyadobacter]MDR6805802.1 competence protein ComEC [Dyadobacter fermentans]MDR7042437.1 competence protein ComEC [Dyadobacter sp. BE242]MDR7196750.1 competence protein ComEC [Dyadobacter sp. BE34]MDR7215816.1 competence protein ComEC [Dyadobacter sp. BE31]MDR7263352.1 competence protein ComEC [Dyadobacter sp. BE32]
MLSRAPFVSVVIFLATGILAGDALRTTGISPVVFVSTALVLVTIGCILLYRFGRSTGFAVGLAAWMLLLGAGLKIRAEAERDAQIASVDALEYNTYTAEVTTIPEKRSNSIRFEVHTKQFGLGNHWINYPAKALIYLPDSLSDIPQPGDLLLVRGRLERPASPVNPGQFDYAQYLRNRGILFTAFVNDRSYKRISASSRNSPAYWPEAVSAWADDQFRAYVVDESAYGLVKAMLLGRRDDLGAEQVGDYVISGAVHILSVSGMHVAIIFLAIGMALGWVKRWRFGKWLYLFLMAALLGFYALVTGLPPSVQRAALMCLVLVIAEVSERTHNPMNTLAFSALIILLLDPCALYDVGFQLSYLAMAGIFLFFEPIYGILKPANRVLKFIWQVTALAFAAQIATFPLGIFYFHQFPTYFWLVNPLVVVFTNILLPAALVLLLISLTGISWLGWLVGHVVTFSAQLTDWSASIPRVLPGHLLENLHLNKLEVVLLYSILFAIWYAWHGRSLRWLKVSVVGVTIFATFSIAGSLSVYWNTGPVVFQVPKHRVLSFKSGNRLYLLSDKAFTADTRAFDFNVKNYAVSHEIQQIIRITAP